MDFRKITQDGLPTVLNLSLVTRAAFNETERQLHIYFLGGESMTLKEEEAERVWIAFSEYYADEEDLPESPEDEREELDDFNREIAALERQLKRPAGISIWDATRLREEADSLGERRYLKKKRDLAEEVKKLQERAYAVADAAEVAVHTRNIDECLNTPIINVVSVKTNLKKLDEAVEALQEKEKLTDGISKKVRLAKERLAWFRTRKKLDDARVAEAGGSLGKRDKYNREAEVLLKQDWAIVFPEEEAPNLDSVGKN
jgi:hypothetical protein